MRTALIGAVARAIATFERTLISGDSAYDRRVYLDQRSAMSEAARRGMRLFFSEQAACFHCHGGVNFSGPTVTADLPRRRSRSPLAPLGRDADGAFWTTRWRFSEASLTRASSRIHDSRILLPPSQGSQAESSGKIGE